MVGSRQQAVGSCLAAMFPHLDSAMLPCDVFARQAGWGKCVQYGLRETCSAWCSNCGVPLTAPRHHPCQPPLPTPPSAPWVPASPAPPTHPSPPLHPQTRDLLLGGWVGLATAFAALACCACVLRLMPGLISRSRRPAGHTATSCPADEFDTRNLASNLALKPNLAPELAPELAVELVDSEPALERTS